MEPNDRREDWRKGVDESLMALTSAQRVTDRQLDDLEINYEAIDKLLRGNPEEDTDGLIARLHAQENLLADLRAEQKRISHDLHGYPDKSDGIFRRLEKVEGKRAWSEKTQDNVWQFATKVTVQVLIMIGMLILGWDKVADLIKKIPHHKPTEYEKMLEKAKRPRSQKKIPRAAPKVPDTPTTPSE